MLDRVIQDRAAFDQAEVGLALAKDRQQQLVNDIEKNGTQFYNQADSTARAAAELMIASDVLAFFAQAPDEEFFSLQLKIK